MQGDAVTQEHSLCLDTGVSGGAMDFRDSKE